MLKQDVNELLTRTGPGTEMGDLFRRYWMPALLAEELPEDGCPPVRVKLLSERMIAFRDSEGRYGLLDEFCAHRGASLWFGNNEDGGLRCAYHGWKYDVTGACLDVPSEPENSSFCKKVKLTAYPLVKIGDVLWTYMGDPADQPPLPEFEWCLVPPEQTYTSKRWQESNWLQALEGGIDSSHVSWLHSAGLKNDPLFKGSKGNEYNLNDMRPFFEVVDADGGLFVGVRRNAEEGQYYWRITPWVMPAFTMVPPRGDHPVHGHFWVPIDDENCWVFTFDYLPARALTAAELQAMKDGHGVHNEYVPGTYRPLANKDNDYLMDRDGAAARRDVLRRQGHRDPGRVAAGEHGPDRRPLQGAAGLRRQRDHQGPAASCSPRRSRCARTARCRRASTRPTTGSGRPRSCCPRSGRSSTPPATRSA